MNILRDAGDVTSVLTDLGVDLVLCGQRNVPYAWDISGVRVIHSGTVSSERLRGNFGPSYNVIEFGPEEVRIELKRPGGEDQPLARFDRGIERTSELYLDFGQYVRYANLPF